MADPGFPRGASIYCLANFGWKLHKNERIWTESGNAFLVPLGYATEKCILFCNDIESTWKFLEVSCGKNISREVFLLKIVFMFLYFLRKILGSLASLWVFKTQHQEGDNFDHWSWSHLCDLIGYNSLEDLSVRITFPSCCLESSHVCQRPCDVQIQKSFISDFKLDSYLGNNFKAITHLTQSFMRLGGRKSTPFLLI